MQWPEVFGSGRQHISGGQGLVAAVALFEGFSDVADLVELSAVNCAAAASLKVFLCSCRIGEEHNQLLGISVFVRPQFERIVSNGRIR